MPQARSAATFIYEGALPLSQGSNNGISSVGEDLKTLDQVLFDHFEASYFNRWIELRNPSKS
ncbi:MAG: hypothetical protein HQL14_01505 [Candidatus Omnitrophica bacterium]|nr:hypothetical protein [Candidatus Omnitrophota bacterium]